MYEVQFENRASLSLLFFFLARLNCDENENQGIIEEYWRTLKGNRIEKQEKENKENKKEKIKERRKRKTKKKRKKNKNFFPN